MDPWFSFSFENWKLVLFLTERSVHDSRNAANWLSPLLCFPTCLFFPPHSWTHLPTSQHLLRPMQQVGIKKRWRERIKSMIIAGCWDMHTSIRTLRISAQKDFFFSEGGKLHHYYALDCMHAKQVAQHRCRESSRQPQGLTNHCHMTMTHMIFLF